ncbi:MAG: hypothetical protein ACLU1V_14500 [Bacteroides fragilis]
MTLRRKLRRYRSESLIAEEKYEAMCKLKCGVQDDWNAACLRWSRFVTGGKGKTTWWPSPIIIPAKTAYHDQEWIPQINCRALYLTMESLARRSGKKSFFIFLCHRWRTLINKNVAGEVLQA